MPASHNVREFQKALQAKMRATRKTEAEVLNHACRNVAFRAAQFTPKSSAAKIKAGFRNDNLLAKLASRNLKQRQGRFTRAEHTAEMRRIQTKATRSVGAVRASWFGALTAMGANVRGRKPAPGTNSARGGGKRATAGHLLASIWSAIVTTNARGRKTSAAEIIPLRLALDKAVRFVTADTIAYAQKRIGQTLKRS
jgi:hypothetical protein